MMPRRWESSMLSRELRQMRWVFLAPSLFLFTGLVAIPGVYAFVYSVQRWDGLSGAEWIGLENFRALFRDDLFLSALKNNATLAVGAGTLTFILSLLFAALIHRGIRGAGLFRIGFFFPNVISAVAVAILWQLMYSTTDFGVINAVLVNIQDLIAWVGIADLDWFPYAFTDSKVLVYALIPMVTWVSVGFYMILFLAAMQGVPEELYEAASIEGATPRQQLWHVTLPLIREVLIVGVVFFIISSAKFFDAIWIMESEIPNKDSHVMATVLYQKVFSEYNVGYASAVAVVLFGLVFIATLVTLNFSRKESLEY